MSQYRYTLVLKLTSGAALLGFSAPVCSLAGAEDRGLQAWVAEDSTKIGWLMGVDPRRGLPRELLDRNTGLVCPDLDWKYLKKNMHRVQLKMDEIKRFVYMALWHVVRLIERINFLLYLFAGRLFLMQHIKLPNTRTNNNSKPTASDTANTTESSSAHTQKHTWLSQYSFVAHGWAT